MGKPVTPLVAVDIIIEYGEGIVLIERKNEPFGWALPGGFVDVGEPLERAAMRRHWKKRLSAWSSGSCCTFTASPVGIAGAIP